MDKRTKDTYQKMLYNFIHDVLVVCPICGKKAVVLTGNFSIHDLIIEDVRIVCPGCGFNKILTDYIPESEFSLTIGEAKDPFFKLPLWLATNFKDQIFWAYNHEHLEFLQQHIDSRLRERNKGEYSNRSLGSRLPKWMTQKGNRDSLLRIIDRLKSKV